MSNTLSQLQHGILFQSKKDALAKNYGSIVKYICDTGYILNGNAQILIVERTCQSDGKWSGHEPTCEAIVCPTLSRIQIGRLLRDTSNGFANNYETENEYTCDKGMCVKQVKREIVRLAKSGSRPAIELQRYACNFGNYAVRVRIKEVTYNDKTQMTAIGIVMASLIQGIEDLQKEDEMFFHSNISCRFQELEQGKTYIITGYDGNKFRDDEGHVRIVYPIMGTTLVMEYISPQQYRVDRRNYDILYKVQSNFEHIMSSGCPNK
ncbi:uncharacterized protein LOC132738908 [Ruditapes philippinarum]|uniref:uncharacterized protein LOC132738908 n=1 Tax=Ruditapes philippinarum TaxID=129788 RepID=UPI00295B34A8|nr:uncharacterized protein LOC132738908 [Ruditapes philippinarum]